MLFRSGGTTGKWRRRTSYTSMRPSCRLQRQREWCSRSTTAAFNLSSCPVQRSCRLLITPSATLSRSMNPRAIARSSSVARTVGCGDTARKDVAAAGDVPRSQCPGRAVARAAGFGNGQWDRRRYRIVTCHDPHVDCEPAAFGAPMIARAPVMTDYAAVLDRKSTRLNSSHSGESRMPSSA